MSEWKENSLENVTIFIKDGSHGTHRDYENGIPLLSAKDIVGGKVVLPEDCRKISQIDFDKIHANYEIQENDLALTIVGTIGRVALVEKIRRKFTFQRSVAIFRIDPLKLEPRYCYHFFTSNQFQQSLERSKNASAQGGVYLGELAKIKISYPKEISLQRRISKILSTCDAVIEKTKATIEKYKAIKQGMLHDLFTRGIDVNTGKLRPLYEDAPELYKETKLGMVPREWEVVSLGDVCSMKSGEGITSKSIQEMGNYPAYGGNGLRGYTENYTHDGEFTLIGRQGALCGNITRVSGRIYASEHAVVVTVEKNIDVDWISQILDTMDLNQYSEASAQPGLSVAKILRLKIAKPMFDEQKMISERLLQIDNKLQTEQTYLSKLQMLKSGLMGDLLSGRVRIM